MDNTTNFSIIQDDSLWADVPRVTSQSHLRGGDALLFIDGCDGHLGLGAQPLLLFERGFIIDVLLALGNRMGNQAWFVTGDDVPAVMYHTLRMDPSIPTVEVLTVVEDHELAVLLVLSYVIVTVVVTSVCIEVSP